ncbi:MAG TPA: anti-sigma factor [Kouleothrix sp.]|jgi:anti-sigma-K factor RskA|nr:anti-sigma factor [Kouleothrix sp.]
MNTHPIDNLPAFVLGVLAPEEAHQIGTHLLGCADCRAEAAAFQSSLAIPPTPRAHVKQQLFTHITENQAHLRSIRWLQIALVTALVLAFICGAAAFDARNRLSTATTELAHQQRLAVFIAAPQTLLRRLDSPNHRSHAVMYMQPNSTQAVLVVQSLPEAAVGTTYQFWLARPGIQVPATTFVVDSDGNATLTIDAPAPVNTYDQIMVTLEPSGGSQHPSSHIVLSGSLTLAIQHMPQGFTL